MNDYLHQRIFCNETSDWSVKYSSKDWK